MKTIVNRAEAEHVEKKSRFIAAAVPVTSEEEAASAINEIRKRHYDARHNVFAYVIRNSEGRGVTKRFSDDGEPSGTAGAPVLNVIEGLGLSDALIVVTRYFGGTLLGAGGLVRAYSKAAKMAVEAAEIVEKLPYTETKVVVSYHQSGKTRYDIENGGFTITAADFGADVTFTVLVGTDKTEQFLNMITDATNATAIIEQGENVFC